MMSAHDCYHHAKSCETMATTAADGQHRVVLRALAVQWRGLGDASPAHAARLARCYALIDGHALYVQAIKDAA